MSETKSLPAIIKETTEIVQTLIDNDGELPAELELQQAENAQALAQKTDSYGYVLDEIGARIAFLKSKLDQYKDVIAKLERADESIQERMLWAMNQLQVTELIGDETRFTIAQNPPRVVIDDENSIPNVYFKVPEVKPVLDKKALSEAMKSGAVVPGAHVERGVRLARKLNTTAKKLKGVS